MKEKHLYLMLGAAVSALGGVFWLDSHLKPEPEQVNWARRWAEGSSIDGKVKHYIQRNGNHLYVANAEHGTVMFLDADNNGFPEQEVYFTEEVIKVDCREELRRGGWIHEFSNNPLLTSYGAPEFKPISTKFLKEQRIPR